MNFAPEDFTFTPSAAVASIVTGAAVQLYTVARTLGELSEAEYDVSIEDSAGALFGETVCRLMAALAESDDGVAIDPAVRELLQSGAARLLMSMRALGLALYQTGERVVVKPFSFGGASGDEPLNYTKNLARYRKDARIQGLLRTFRQSADQLTELFTPKFFPMVRGDLSSMKALVELIGKSVVLEWTEPLPAKTAPGGQNFGRFQAQLRLHQKVYDSIVFESAKTAGVLYDNIKGVVGTNAFLERYKMAPVRSYTTPKDFGYDEDEGEEEEEGDENTIDEDE